MKASVTHLTAQRMLFGCCCGNNVGQFATVAVTELSREGVWAFWLTDRPGGRWCGVTNSNWPGSDSRHRFRGRCGKKILDAGGLTCSHSLALIDLGIEITSGPKYAPTDLELVKDAIIAACADCKTAAPPGCCRCRTGK